MNGEYLNWQEALVEHNNGKIVICILPIPYDLIGFSAWATNIRSDETVFDNYLLNLRIWKIVE